MKQMKKISRMKEPNMQDIVRLALNPSFSK